MGRELQKGDYVLATKYSDGDPYDGYAVGFFDCMLPGDGRYMVVDSAGKQYRGNGFRRCERISEELGNWIVHNRITIEATTRIAPINIWRYLRAPARAELEASLSDPMIQHYRSVIAREALVMGHLRDDEQAALNPARNPPSIPSEASTGTLAQDDQNPSRPGLAK